MLHYDRQSSRQPAIYSQLRCDRFGSTAEPKRTDAVGVPEIGTSEAQTSEKRLMVRSQRMHAFNWHELDIHSNVIGKSVPSGKGNGMAISWYFQKHTACVQIARCILYHHMFGVI